MSTPARQQRRSRSRPPAGLHGDAWAGMDDAVGDVATALALFISDFTHLEN